MTSVLLRGTQRRDRGRGEVAHHRMGGDWSYTATRAGTPGKSKEESPGAFEGSMALPAPWFQASGFQNCEWIDLYVTVWSHSPRGLRILTNAVSKHKRNKYSIPRNHLGSPRAIPAEKSNDGKRVWAQWRTQSLEITQNMSKTCAVSNSLKGSPATFCL